MTEPEPATGSEVRPCKKVVHMSRVWKARAQFFHLPRLAAVDEQTVGNSSRNNTRIVSRVRHSYRSKSES
jgi:hypothetical protein